MRWLSSNYRYLIEAIVPGLPPRGRGGAGPHLLEITTLLTLPLLTVLAMRSARRPPEMLVLLIYRRAFPLSFAARQTDRALSAPQILDSANSVFGRKHLMSVPGASRRFAALQYFGGYRRHSGLGRPSNSMFMSSRPKQITSRSKSCQSETFTKLFLRTHASPFRASFSRSRRRPASFSSMLMRLSMQKLILVESPGSASPCLSFCRIGTDPCTVTLSFQKTTFSM